MIRRLSVPMAQVEQQSVTYEEHDAWAAKLWARMDRNHDGFITRKELDCEEFREVLKFVLTPNSAVMGTGGVGYGRSQQNIEQALQFCLRKADFNHDCSLSYEEFKSFLGVLRMEQDAAHTCDLIFALFDYDMDNRISEREFREIYRYFLGHHPTAAEFAEEWARLDMEGNQYVGREEYVRWLQTSPNPIFRQHAPPIRDWYEPDRERPKASRLPGLARTDSFAKSRLWNCHFNSNTNPNDTLPANERSYFSRPASLPELERFYSTHRGFDEHLKRLKLPQPKRHQLIATPDARHVRGGRMTTRNVETKRREVVPWEDHWQEPKDLTLKKVVKPGSLMLRIPGPPPHFLAERGVD